MQVEEIFTPRRPTINEEMYISRPELEENLLLSIKGSMHTFLFGESGNGKTWLYKHVLNKNKIPYVVINGGNVSRRSSLTKAIFDAIIATGTSCKTGYIETKEAEVSAITLMKAGVKHEGEYEIHQDEPLLNAFKEFDKNHNKTNKIIVIDNLEAIYKNTDLMSELADIILLLDDEQYARYFVKFLIVGTPYDVLEYFRRTKNFESVANRIEETDIVDGLNKTQVQKLVTKGFTLLATKGVNGFLGDIGNHVFHATMGIPQRIHEYCVALANLLEKNNKFYTTDLLEKADLQWLKSGLRKSYQVIENHLNIKDKGVGRKNQVIYVIGLLTSHQFDLGKIEKLVKEQFPDFAKEHMGIGKILQDFSQEAPELLVRNKKTGEYSIKDPKYIMCIRLILAKDQHNKIIKKKFQLK